MAQLQRFVTLLAYAVLVLPSCTAVTAGMTAPGEIEPQTDSDPPSDTAEAPAKRPPSTKAPTNELDQAKLELLERFDRLLSDEDEYRRRVRSECKRFPEGDLFPYTLTAMAYANLAMSDSERREHALEIMEPLLDQAIRSTAAKVAPRSGSLEKLAGYGGHGCYLGQLNLALASWRLAGGDERYMPLHRHLTELLARELERRGGRPIKSFPGYSWTFDTVPALVSVAASDRIDGGRRATPLLKAHREWVRDHGLHPETKLPWSRATGRGKGLTVPRGCDLSWRIALLANVDRRWSEELYEHYTSSFWLERRMMAGFAEWPGGRRGR